MRAARGVIVQGVNPAFGVRRLLEWTSSTATTVVGRVYLAHRHSRTGP